VVAFDQGADEVEVGLRSGRERGFDFLHADGDQGLPEAQFFTASIGSISDWLPSRRSELHQIGAVVMVFDGQVRSGISMGRKRGGYFGRRVFEHAHREILWWRGRKRAACRKIVMGYKTRDEADRFSLAVVR